jgi:hypothetical protein
MQFAMATIKKSPVYTFPYTLKHTLLGTQELPLILDAIYRYEYPSSRTLPISTQLNSLSFPTMMIRYDT